MEAVHAVTSSLDRYEIYDRETSCYAVSLCFERATDQDMDTVNGLWDGPFYNSLECAERWLLIRMLRLRQGSPGVLKTGSKLFVAV